MSNNLDGFNGSGRMERRAWEPILTHSPSMSSASKMTLFAGPSSDGGDWNAAKASQASKMNSPEPEATDDKPKVMAVRRKEKMEMPICTRVSLSTFRTLEVWCDNSFRKRSEVVGIVLERIVEILSQQRCIEQPVEEFVRKLRVEPKT